MGMKGIADCGSTLADDEMHPPRGTMKMYICSTKSDFVWEREKLWSDVLWEVEEMARAHGLSITLVDMYLGADHDPVNDRHTLDEYLQEIKHAHQESAGPFFLCFLGDKYGPVPLARTLNAEDLHTIKKQAFDDGKDVRLLKEWYVESGDEFVLRPTPYRYKQYGLSSRNSSKCTEDAGDVLTWSRDFVHLQEMLQSYFQQQVEGQRQHQPTLPPVSGVEEQINIALDLNPAGCLVIKRTLNDIRLDDPVGANYVDTVRNTKGIDKDATERLKKLHGRLQLLLSETNMVSFEVPWAPTGFDPMKYTEHAHYLYTLGNYIVTWVTEQISNQVHIKDPRTDQYSVNSLDIERPLHNNTINSMDFEKPIQNQTMNSLHFDRTTLDQVLNGMDFGRLLPDQSMDRLKSELLTHNLHARQLGNCQLYGFDKVEDMLNNSLFEDNLIEKQQMMLVHGSDGCGKSSLLVHWMRGLQASLGSQLELVVRFVGLTCMSSTPEELLRSLCSQLNLLLKCKFEVKPLSLKALVNQFLSFMPIMAAITHKKFVFVIDALDKLRTASYDSESYFWEGMAAKLPTNVHLVVSFTTSSKNSPLFHRVSNHISQENHILQVPSIGPDALMLVLEDVVRRQGLMPPYNKGKMTPPSFKQQDMFFPQEQQLLVKAMIRHESVPLFSRLLAIEAKTWCLVGYQNIDIDGLTCTLEEMVNHCLVTLEERYGDVTIMAVSRYLTASLYGLTEGEMLDLLSCNNAVLQYVYPDYMPTLLRFPYTLWLKIRNDMDLLIEKKVVEGKTLYSWSHTVISNAAATRYFTTSEEIKWSHQDIANLFLNTWVGNKPMVLPSRGLLIIDTGSRHVGQQPLLYSETQYNHRRLTEVWYQLLHAGDVERFKQESFCNFNFLLARAHSSGAQSLLADFRWTCDHVLDGEIKLLLRCLEVALPVITNDPLQLASQLIGRLRVLKDMLNKGSFIIQFFRLTPEGLETFAPAHQEGADEFPGHIDTLVQQCMEWCDSYNLPLVVPLSSWLPDPRIPLVATLEEPAGIAVICPTHNNQHAFCATLSHHIHMYHIPSQRLIKILTGHTSKITCLAMTFNSKYLVSGSDDCTLRVWDISKGKATQVIREHKAAILCLIIVNNDDIIITGSEDHKVRLISIATEDVLHTLDAHKGPVVSVLLNKNNTILATGSKDGKVMLWDLEDMTLLNVINENSPSPIISMALTCDNTFLIVGFDDGSLCVKSFTTGSDIHQLEGHAGKVCSLAVSSDCYHAAVGCSDGNLYLYNIRTRDLLDAFSGHAYPIASVCCTSNQHFVISAAKDKLNVWTFYRRHTHHLLTDEHTKTVTCVNLSQDGKTAITGATDRVVKLWNMDICDFSADLVGHTGTVTSVALSDNEVFAVSGSEDTTVKVWSITMGCIITDYKEHGSTVTSVFVLSDNERIMSAEEKGYMKLWMAETGETKLSVSGPTAQLTLSPDFNFAISGDFSNTLKIWSVDDGRVIQDIAHNETIMCLTYSADSKYVVTGSSDMSLKVWEVLSGKLIQVLVEHEDTVSCVTVTQSNRYIISGSYDCNVLIWQLETGEVKHRLSGHTNHVTVIKVNNEGSVAVSGSKDGSLRVWNVAHGSLFTTFNLHSSVIGLFITDKASHIVVQLERSLHVPLLCLHNSPAGDAPNLVSGSLVQGNPILPLKPLPLLNRKPHSVFPVPMPNKTRDSMSPIPEIIKVSPISVPISLRVKSQEKNREVRGHKSAMKVKTGHTKDLVDTENKKSWICVIL